MLAVAIFCSPEGTNDGEREKPRAIIMVVSTKIVRIFLPIVVIGLLYLRRMYLISV